MVVRKNKKKAGKKIGVVVSRFNEFITRRLLDGCLDELSRCGVSKNDITVVWVPGAWEIPVVAFKLARKENIQAVICLGAVIKGETLHFELVSQEAARGIMRASLETGKPVIFEVLATETIDQANRRSSEKGDNKGRDAALVAIEMIRLLENI